MPTSITVRTSKPSDLRCLKKRPKFRTGAFVRNKRRPRVSRTRLTAWNTAETNAFMELQTDKERCCKAHAVICNQLFGLVDQPSRPVKRRLFERRQRNQHENSCDR